MAVERLSCWLAGWLAGWLHNRRTDVMHIQRDCCDGFCLNSRLFDKRLWAVRQEARSLGWTDLFHESLARCKAKYHDIITLYCQGEFICVCVYICVRVQHLIALKWILIFNDQTITPATLSLFLSLCRSFLLSEGGSCCLLASPA